MHLFLASQSPRRRDLLAQIGIEFETIDVAVHEAPAEGEAPYSAQGELLEKLAR